MATGIYIYSLVFAENIFSISKILGAFNFITGAFIELLERGIEWTLFIIYDYITTFSHKHK